jgi:hypothetical protein
MAPQLYAVPSLPNLHRQPSYLQCPPQALAPIRLVYHCRSAQPSRRNLGYLPSPQTLHQLDPRPLRNQRKQKSGQSSKECNKAPPRLGTAPNHCLTLKSVCKQQLKSDANELWSVYWAHQPSTHLQQIIQDSSMSNGPKLYLKFKGRESATRLAQLQMGHCGLQAYLHHFKKADDVHCKCGEGYETIEHYLLACSRYLEQRKLLHENTSTGQMRVKTLLSDMKLVNHTMDFVRSTGRFD